MHTDSSQNPWYRAMLPMPLRATRPVRSRRSGWLPGLALPAAADESENQEGEASWFASSLALAHGLDVIEWHGEPLDQPELVQPLGVEPG